MQFSGEKLTARRIFNYIFGLYLITLGVAFSIKSGLGSAPVSSIPYSMNLIWAIEIGIATIIFHSMLVIIESHRPFSRIKVYLDISIVSSALILSYIFLGNIRSVGLGTVLGAVFVGTTVKYIHKLNKHITGEHVDLKKM